MFINRTSELAWLEKQYQEVKKQAQLLVIYGKRRVGKTELVNHFAKAKNHVYYLASRGNAKLQLQTAIPILTQKIGPTPLPQNAFSSWRDLFDYLGKNTQNLTEPLIITIDEFPFLIDSDSAISSYFQYGWDMYFKDRKIMLILMGSSISMMYQHALFYRAPIYGRRTGQWLVEPFSYHQSKNFYPNSPFENTFSLYALTGGIPAYAKVFDGQKSLQKNIEEYILPEGSFLNSEPELLLSEEFSDPKSYLAILKSIGLGRTKFSQIIQDTELPSTALPGYLKTLIQLRLIKKEAPVTDKLPEKSKRGYYSLADPFLRFYFSFIFPNLSQIKNKNYPALFTSNPQILTQLISKSYENATEEFIRQVIQKGLLPEFEALGRWWDKNTEIDLVGLNEKDNSVLFVETKWNSKPIDIDVLYDLKNKSTKINWNKINRKEYFALVAKGGFSQKLIDQSRKEQILLIQQDFILPAQT